MQQVTDDQRIELLPSKLENYLVTHGLDPDWLEEFQRKDLENIWKDLKVAECECIHSKARFESNFQMIKLQVYTRHFGDQ